MLVCVYTYIHMCLLFSVCLRPSSQLARGHVCTSKRICTYCLEARIKFRCVRALTLVEERGGVKSAAGGGGYSFCPGVTGPLQEECLGHMGQRVHSNGPPVS